MAIRLARVGLLGLLCVVTSDSVFAGAKKPEQAKQVSHAKQTGSTSKPAKTGNTKLQDQPTQPQELHERQQVQVVVPVLEGPYRKLVYRLVVPYSEREVLKALRHLSDEEKSELRDLLVQERFFLEHGVSMAGIVGQPSWVPRWAPRVFFGTVKGLIGASIGLIAGVVGGVALFGLPFAIKIGIFTTYAPTVTSVVGCSTAIVGCTAAGAGAGVAHEYYAGNRAGDESVSPYCMRRITRIDYILECLER